MNMSPVSKRSDDTLCTSCRLAVVAATKYNSIYGYVQMITLLHKAGAIAFAQNCLDKVTASLYNNYFSSSTAAYKD